MGKFIHTNISQIEPKHHSHEQYEYTRHDVTDKHEKYQVISPNEGNQTVVAFYTLPPGKSSYPFHYHTTNEEVYYIIAGNGEVETFEGKHPVAAGDVIIFPVGKHGAHKITNTGNEPLVYLDVDTNNTPDIAYYPHSNKVGIRSVGCHDNYRTDNTLAYYDGE